MSQLVQKDTDCSPKDFWSTIRIALSGESHGPALDMIIKIYGKDKVKLLINNALKL